MRAFTDGQRVIVDQPELESHACLRGKTGTVRRCRRGDNGAWVRMDEPLPAGVSEFPADDPRGQDVLLYPGECMPAETRAPK